MKTISLCLCFLFALAILATPTRSSSSRPVVAADTCYFDEDGNMTCVPDDPWNPCGDGSCQ